MLIIISDVHLGDGTCGKSINAGAFELFADRLKELAYNASWRTDNTYKPIEKINILLLGDIIEVLHSVQWADTKPGTPEYIRPWSDPFNPKFAAKLNQITQAILQHNQDALRILRRIAAGEIVQLPPATSKGEPDHQSAERLRIPVHIYYMVGNHDWYYRLPGQVYDNIRKSLIVGLGLSNTPAPFPYHIDECDALHDMLAAYKVYARHGDLYDSFNYDKRKGRNAAALGDVFAVEILNRFPLEVQQQLGDKVPASFVDSLRELTNVRPALATPLWISNQMRHNNLERSLQNKLKKIWDNMSNEFLSLDIVRTDDKWLKFDPIDALGLTLKLTQFASTKTINDVALWMRNKVWKGKLSFAENALKEEPFLSRNASYIVYGHTHHHEIVPLDTVGSIPHWSNQLYLNTGTWRTYYDLAVHKPEEQKFIPYQVLTYLAFYKDDQRQGRRFETWSGAFA